MSKLAKVIIVGRTNVGKSTLFNRLSVDVKSLVLDYEGVTRDFIHDVVDWQGTSFELIDSGGISLRKSNDPLSEKVRLLGISLLETADTIVFVCDGIAGLVTEDREIAGLLHTLGKDVILVVNKTESERGTQEAYEFQKLGFSHTFYVSAQHGLGIGDLLDAIVSSLQHKRITHAQEATTYKVVLLGKPNVGKSSLMNLLLERERSLVAPEAGTTREAITESMKFYKETIQLTDTPGIRRKRGVTDTLETMMVKTSFRAVEQADIVLLMLDGSDAQLSDQELKLAFYAFEKQHKAVILLINKDDLIDEYKRSELDHNFELYQHVLKKISILTISCLKRKNIGKIIPLVQKTWERYSQTLPDSMNDILKQALQERPLYHKTNLLILYKARQLKTSPVTVALFVNEPKWFGPSQMSFFENVLRKKYDLQGVPVRIIIRKAA